MVAVAAAFGLQSIDLVCVDYKNPEILKEECEEGRAFGFTGKQAIHPNQVDLIQASFCPSAEGNLPEESNTNRNRAGH